MFTYSGIRTTTRCSLSRPPVSSSPDRISYRRPKAYLDEIRKITQAPIKYLIYSHHHYDHIAGGKVFKDAGPNGRLGTRKDMEEQIAFMTDLASEVKKASDAGKCFDPATKEVRVPKYQTLTNYEQNIEWNVHRWCGYYGRGI